MAGHEAGESRPTPRMVREELERQWGFDNDDWFELRQGRSERRAARHDRNRSELCQPEADRANG